MPPRLGRWFEAFLPLQNSHISIFYEDGRFLGLSFFRLGGCCNTEVVRLFACFACVQRRGQVMRGSDDQPGKMLSHSNVSCRARVPPEHPLRTIRAVRDEALEGVS